MRRGLGPAALLLALGSGVAAANLRAPMRIPAAPSTALYPAEGITVRGERLRFDCDGEGCEVRATYLVEAREATVVALSFITPERGRVEVSLSGGDAPVPIQVVAAQPLSEGEAEALRDAVQDDLPLSRARFSAPLPAGASELTVSYRQTLALEEVGHSYLSDGELLRVVEYHLWPITEWAAAPDFALDLSVSAPREAPGAWQRLWGSYASVGCGAVDEAGGALRAQEGDRLVYHAIVPAAGMPKVLRCAFGTPGRVER